MLQYSTFEELYLTGCRLRKEEPLYLSHFVDLDKLLNKVLHNKFFMDALLCPKLYYPYNDFPFKNKLPPDILKGEEFIYTSYGHLESIVTLINLMDNNDNIHLNRWKLDRLERVIKHGWKSYCDFHIDYCFVKKPYI
jgi:hypothetical protein